MRKLFSGLVLALVGCSSTPSNLTKQDFVGDWSCSIKYEDIGVGTIDLIYLKSMIIFLYYRNLRRHAHYRRVSRPGSAQELLLAR